ncbi:hypothetical protein B0H13DRAFT_871701 [Mycena leptocephala]|nr:hypothetical protein B0H13DRAFT_871701 [Mycena leptocephala]
MDDSPPPAYSKEYKRQVVDSLNITPVPSHNPNGTETPSASKRADGRGPFPRPLPRLPAGESPSVKTGTVAPLRLHKKSQSTAIPSIARPWKPSTVDGAPLNSPRWDPVVQNPPQFRHREAEFAQSLSSHQKYPRPPATALPMHVEYGRSAGHFRTPTLNHGHAELPPNQVDPKAFYNPAVSGHLSRPSVSHAPQRTLLDIRPNQSSSNISLNSGRRVRWDSQS